MRVEASPLDVVDGREGNVTFREGTGRGLGVWLRRQVGLYWRALRPKESVMMLGVPTLGMLFALDHLSLEVLWRMLLLFAGAALVAGHVYTLNDLLGLSYDIYDASKLDRPLMSGALRAREVWFFSLAMLAVGLAILYGLSFEVFSVGVSIVLLWAAYGAPRINLKSVPVVTSLLNGVGAGSLPFLLGYGLFAPERMWREGLALSVYCGIIAGAGQLNREIVDEEVDEMGGIRTTARWLGREQTFVLSFACFMASTAYLSILSACGLAPATLVALVVTATPIHLFIFARCYRAGLGRQAVIDYVRQYRLLYLVVGVGMVADLTWRLVTQ